MGKGLNYFFNLGIFWYLSGQSASFPCCIVEIDLGQLGRADFWRSAVRRRCCFVWVGDRRAGGLRGEPDRNDLGWFPEQEMILVPLSSFCRGTDRWERGDNGQ